MSSLLLEDDQEYIDDIDSQITNIFDEANNVKTEINIVTYDENDNKLHSENTEYSLRFERDDINDEKELKKFIKKCESMIRICPEYSDWTDYIRNVMEMTSCAITGELHQHAKSDIHHHPFCLYTIVKAVILKYIASNKPFTSIDVCKEVMELHYKMKAPFIVLLKSIHEKYHNSYLNLPMELVQGDTQYFIKHYSQYLNEEDLNPILDRLRITWDNCGYDKFKYSWNK